MKQQNIIEINGKKYDAITGKMIQESAQSAQAVAHKTAPTTGKVLDGFMRKGTRKPNHAKKTVQKSQTLMRQVVKKPTPKTTVSTPQVVHKASLGQSLHREHIAATVSKNPSVSRFNTHTNPSPIIKKVQHLPVKHPAQQATHQQKSHAPVRAAMHAPAVKAKHEPVRNNNVASKAIVERALATADAHEAPMHHPRKKRKLMHKLGISARAMTISSTVFAVALLSGFYAIQNVPNLSMRVAATRAGFDASMPGFSPSGFSFKGPINYAPGQVTISFQSRTDDRTYNVVEQESSWNSDALLANYVVSETNQYQTYLDRGRTLYIYNGSNATWVDNGIWYQIVGDSDLTTDQLVRIAASI